MNAIDSHLRLTILRVLLAAPSYTANSSIVASVAQEFGLVASRDKIKTEAAWLVEQGLITTRDVGAMVVATLTDRGQDVAEGRSIAPGVQRPSPGS